VLMVNTTTVLLSWVHHGKDSLPFGEVGRLLRGLVPPDL